MTSIFRAACVALFLAAVVRAGEPTEPKITGLSVNGEKIAAAEVKRYYDWYMEGAKMANKENRPLPPDFTSRLVEQARQQVIQQTIVRQYVKNNNLSATPERVKSEVAMIKEQIESNGMTFNDFLKKRTLTETQFNEEVGYLTAVVESCSSKFDQAKMKEQFAKEKEQIPLRRASHILFMHKDSPDTQQAARTTEDAKKLAHATLERIKKGDDFAKLAKENSDCPSKAGGGDLDWFVKDQMVKPFGDTVYSMAKVGDVSDVVETKFGFHIIKLTGIRSDEEAYNTYVRQQAQDQAEGIIKKLFDEAKIGDE